MAEEAGTSVGAEALAAVEAGVLCGVRDPTAARQRAACARGGLQCALLAVHEVDGACAAELSWLSQYPSEDEYASPPLTALTVTRGRVDGGALRVDVQPGPPSVDH